MMLTKKITFSGARFPPQNYKLLAPKSNLGFLKKDQRVDPLDRHGVESLWRRMTRFRTPFNGIKMHH